MVATTVWTSLKIRLFYAVGGGLSTVRQGSQRVSSLSPDFGWVGVRMVGTPVRGWADGVLRLMYLVLAPEPQTVITKA